MALLGGEEIQGKIDNRGQEPGSPIKLLRGGRSCLITCKGTENEQTS